MNLYITQDRIGTPTGGGAVTYHEYRALESLKEETHPVDAGRIPVGQDPFVNDMAFSNAVKGAENVRLAAFYAGCFTETISSIRSRAKTSYTAAAHDIVESRREFEDLGIPFNFPHLNAPELWDRYVRGYILADLVVCPSTLSKKCMESYGCKNVVVIPHGCEIPEDSSGQPKRFTVGYLGQAGPDKGLRYLFEAWKKLGYKDATLLIAGNNIDQALPLYRRFGGGNVEFIGFVKSVSEFYNRISIYVQPSVTEGFGIEVLEAQAYGRRALCSTGAGASDVVDPDSRFKPRDSDAIALLIQKARAELGQTGINYRMVAQGYTWEKVRGMYRDAWRELLK